MASCWNSGGILFLVEWYNILLLRNKAALSRYSVNLTLFICDLVVSDWIIYRFSLSRLSLANLRFVLMGKSIDICWQFVDGRHIGIPPLKIIQYMSTSLEIFYALKLDHRVYCTFLFKFFCVVASWEFFFFFLAQGHIEFEYFFNRSNLSHRWGPNKYYRSRTEWTWE